MNVYIEFVANDGTRYFYPNNSTTTRAYGGWYLPKRVFQIWFQNVEQMEEILDDSDDQIQYLEYLAKAKGWRIELIPINLQIGTYLSTYKHKGAFYEKFIPIWLIVLPFLLMALITYMGWIK
jgi:hypothetical protein